MIRQLLILCILIACINSCTQKQSPLDYSLPAQQIIEDFNVGKLAHEQGIYFEGEVYLRAASGDQLLVMSNSITDHPIAFLLQMEQLPETDLNLSITKAQLLFFHQQLLINDTQSESCYLLQLDDATTLPFTLDFPISDTFRGFGLSQHQGFTMTNDDGAANLRGIGDPGSPPPFEVSCKCISIYTDNSDVDCESGDSGSTSCSTSSGGESCSVDCNGAHYFSCCNNES